MLATVEADESVLTSKITVPALPAWMVSRQRIGTLIAHAARGPLTAVTGPPGAGKTMALASWADAPQPGPVAWVTLDRFDNRPGAFWPYVAEALRRAGVALPAGLPAAAAGAPEEFLRQFALALAGLDPPAALVLDDFHLISDARLLEGLDYLLRNARSGLHLLVASRMDPMLPLHRYRLAGEVTEIRARDLAFSVPEAGLLLAQHGVTLPAESLTTLTRRNEGWAAGLRMAAMSMAGHPDPGQFVKELDAEDGPIAGYLVDEVLNSQPADVRDLLLRTSILDRVSVELAGELTGEAESGGVIPALAQANAFVQPVGNGWYRYHSLFADILRLKLRHESPRLVGQLRGRAARWLWRNGTLREAVTQAAAAGDWPLATRMAVEDLAVGVLLSPLTGQELAEAFRPMPADPAAPEPPDLIVAAALALRQDREDTGAARLAGAERLLGRLPADAELPSRLAAAMLRLTLARRGGDLAAATAAAEQAGSVLGRMPEDMLRRHPEVRLLDLANRGSVEMWAGRLDDAAATLSVCAADACGSCDGIGRRALVEAVRGRLASAGRLGAAACVPPDAGRAWHPSAAAEVALAWVSVEHNRLADAASRLSRAEDALRLQPDRLVGAIACLVAARLRLARGGAGAAMEMIARARRGWSPPPWLDQRLALAASHARAGRGAARQHGPERDEPLIVETLSGRELEVLGYVARMLSTAEIAEQMYLSVNTVKSHLKSIFRKLGVSHRRDAVRRARQLALI